MGSPRNDSIDQLNRDEEKIMDQIREMLDNLWNENLLEDFAFATTYNSIILSILEILKPYFRSKK